MKNRYLLWFSFSFVATVMLCGICKTLGELVFGLGVFVFACMLFLYKEKAKFATVLMLAGIGFSLIWQSLFFTMDKLPSSLLANGISGEVRVISFPEETRFGGISFRAKAYYEKEPIRLLVYADKTEKELSPGDIVNIKARLRSLENTEFFAEETYYKSRHTDVIANADVVEFAGSEKFKRFFYFPEYLAKGLKSMSDRLYSEKVSAFLKSLIFGDTSSLAEDFRDDLRKTGMAHAVSVSGMHISFIVGFIVLFTRNRYLKLCAIPIIFCFAAMVGGSQSVLRAVIMQTLLLLSYVKKREYDPLTSISFAAFILTFINPYCATDISFLLSFFATLGIILLYNPIYSKLCIIGKNLEGYPRKAVNLFASIVAVGFSATIFAAPIMAYAFNSVSVIGPVSNVILNFLVTFIFTGGAISLILGFIFFPVAKGIAAVIGFATECSMNTIRFLAKIPYAEIFTGDKIIILTICFLCFAVSYSILAGRKKIRIPFITTVIALSLLSVFVFKNVNPGNSQYEGIRFDVLDVGQGQCIVATSGEDCVVIDCGGDKEADNLAISHLFKRGISDIDALILTHAHADHANGASQLINTIQTDSVYVPAADRENGIFIRLENSFGDDGEFVYVDEDTELSFSDMKISLLTLPGGKDENENGLVLVVSDGEYEMLITGDIPSKLEKTITERLLDCESYIAGHHGAKTSSSQALLNKALPELCIISVGADNQYGHPSEETLEKFKKIGAKIMRTDIDETITVYSRQVSCK